MASDKELSKRFMLDLTSSWNEDVYNKILNRDMLKYPKRIDYICQAIRAFEENKTDNNIDMNQLKTIVDVMLDEKLKNISISPTNGEEIKTSLEDDISEDINIEDD